MSRSETYVAHGLQKQTSIFVYVDGQEFGELDEAQARGFMARQLAAALPEVIDPEELTLTLSHHDFGGLIEQLTTSGFKTFLLLDEFETLAANPSLTPRFFSGLRALSSQFNLAFVTASRLSLFDLTYAREDTLSSPFFNTFAHINLGLFTENLAGGMIETLAGNVGLSLPSDLIHQIVEVAGPHPFFLQLAAYHACETMDETGEASSIWEQRFEAEAITHFKYYWTHLSTEQKFALTALPFHHESENQIMNVLGEAALIRRNSNGWTYLSQSFERFVRRQTVPNLLQLGPLLLDLAGRRSIGSEGSLRVTKTEFDALAFLIRNAGRVVSPQELENALWGDEYIEDPERVRAVIKGLRKALGEDAEYLTTKWGKGYSLQAPT